jgi:hypothetical protein
MGSTLETTWRGWMVCGKPITISPTADIPTPYRPRQVRAGLVMQALTSVQPWEGSEGVTHTVHLAAKKFPLAVVPLDGLMPMWFKHIGHHAHHVQLSPFVTVSQPRLTSKLTVELVGTVNRAKLVRAYPGEYTPPLPWMGSAEPAPGGVERSIEFWRHHAYVLTDTNTVPGTATGRRAPSWFTTR